MVCGYDIMRIKLRIMRIVIDLETMDELMDRMSFEPLRVLELCAGMSGSYGVSVNMGYKVAVWDAVESNSEVVGMVRKAYPQLNHAGDEVARFIVNGRDH